MARTEVTSEVIGTVSIIEKQVGDAVENGDLIMLLESMKMQIPVEAPAGGTIAEVKVAQGESVEEGQLLCVIES